jgi:Protein of unknown function (DUF2510)
VPTLSGSELIIILALSVVWAVLGYRLSENDRKALGRTPWGLPSGLWAFFWFLSLIVGLVLYLIAHSAGVRRFQQQPSVRPTGLDLDMAGRGPSRPKRTGSISEQFPAYPSPANTQVTREADPGDGQLPQTAPPPTPPMQSPPAWQPDPSGRFHYRWWDGYQWTAQVSTDGHHLVDTNPDQRIGPY